MAREIEDRFNLQRLEEVRKAIKTKDLIEKCWKSPGAAGDLRGSEEIFLDELTKVVRAGAEDVLDVVREASKRRPNWSAVRAALRIFARNRGL